MSSPMNLIPRAGFLLALAGLLLAVPTDVRAQDGDEAEEPEAPWIYMTSYKIPWSRVDSLYKLNKLYPIVATAIANGTVLDHHTIVHHTGDEYNVVIVNVFESWESMGEGNGFGAAFRELEPDAARRAEVNAGYNWVFNDTEHHDNIYREMDRP
ncbi:MAG: hypothetical protein E4H28_02890 [Gemmatimonadales bacterium]|nr:MAG: hypothetical protein E4H28_02890 [Gemmatimonadales bacterium]